MPSKPPKESSFTPKSLLLGIVTLIIIPLIVAFISSYFNTPAQAINYITIENYITGNGNSVIGEIQSIGKGHGEKFEVVRYDSTRGDFELQSRDITFELNRKGIYGEDVQITYSYGNFLNIGFSRFKNGEYETHESSDAINQLIYLIVKSLKGDYTGTSKIKGKVWGFADATFVKKGSTYKGDLGFIQDQPYFIIPFNSSNKTTPPNKFLGKGFELENEDFAFLRAYHFKKRMLDSIKSPSNIKPVIEPNNIEIFITTVPKEDPEQRKVEVVLYFEGALKDKLDKMDVSSKKELKKIYSKSK